MTTVDQCVQLVLGEYVLAGTWYKQLRGLIVREGMQLHTPYTVVLVYISCEGELPLPPPNFLVTFAP